jgi:hypothetical protein
MVHIKLKNYLMQVIKIKKKQSHGTNQIKKNNLMVQIKLKNNVIV